MIKISKIDVSHEAVKKTGKAFLIVGCIVGAILFLSHSDWLHMNWQQGFQSPQWKWFVGIGAAIFALAQVAYPIMKPFHLAWMVLAEALGWLSTRVILSVFFYLIVTPTGLLMKLFGKDLLDEKIDKSAKSYWKKRDLSKFDPKHAARTF